MGTLYKRRPGRSAVILVFGLLLVCMTQLSAAPITYTLNGILGTPPVSGSDPLQLAGSQFQIIATIDSTAPPTSTTANSATYTFPSLTVNVGNLSVALANVPITFTITSSGIPTVAFGTSINLAGTPIALSAVLGLPSGTFTTTTPSAFPSANITPGTDPTLGSILTYGAGDLTTLAVTGTLEAVAVGPALAANPATLSFGFLIGGPNPPAQAFELTAGAVLPVSIATDGAPWISATLSPSATPAVVTVSVDSTGLAAGTYNSTVTVTSSGASNSPLTVPVQFVVSNQPPPNVGNQYPPLNRGQFVEAAPQGFGDRQNGWAWSMEWFKGKLFVGTNRAFHCVEAYAIHRVLPLYQPYPPADPDISCAADFNDLPLQAEIWAWTPDTNTWARVYQSPLTVPNPDSDKPSNRFVPPDIGFRGLTLFTEPDGTQAMYVSGVCSKAIHPLAVGDIPAVPGARILRTVDGVNFTPLPQTTGTFLGDANFASIRGMTSYNGCLYAIAGTLQGAGEIISSCNPSLGDNAWQQVSPTGNQFYEVGTYNGFLYATQSDHKGFSVVKSDATGYPNITFTTVIPNDGYRKLFPNVDGLSLKVFNGDLYIGGDGIHSFFGAEMFRAHADDTWDLVAGIPRDTPVGFKTPISGLGPGFGWFLNAHMWRMEVFDDRLYVGTFDLGTTFRQFPIISGVVAPQLGFDLWWTQNGVNWFAVDQNGFEDKFNFGVRSLKKTDWGLFLGSANYFYGLRIYRGVPAGFNFPPLVNPDNPNFFAYVRSTTPLSLQLNVSSVSNPATFNVTSAVTTPSGGNWLQVAPGSLTPPTNPSTVPLTLTANPTGLPVGMYTGSVNFASTTTSVQREIPVTFQIAPLLIVNPAALTFTAVQGGVIPGPQSFALGGDGGSTTYTAVATVASPTGGTWLQVTPASGTAPWPGTTNLQVSINQTGLTPGTYNGTVTVTSAQQAVQTVAVTLVVQPPTFTTSVPTMNFGYTIGGAMPPVVGLPISDNGAPVPYTVTASSSTTSTSAINSASADSGGWLSVGSPTGTVTTTQSLILVSVSPASLQPGHYTGTLTINAPASANGSQVVSVLLTVLPGSSTGGGTPPPGSAATRTIAELENGLGWRSSLLFVNTDKKPQAAGLKFWGYDGSALSVPLSSGSAPTYSATIPSGGLGVVQTDGSGAGLLQGWAALSADISVGGAAILTAQAGILSPSEIALPLNSQPNQKLLMPFDETSSLQTYATTLALVNSGTSASTAVLTFVDDGGQAIPITGTVTVPANGHYVGELGSMFPPLAGKRGVVMVTSSGGLSGTGYRFNGTAYTALPVLGNVPALSKTISHLVNGSGWKSTIFLVNASPNPAPFTLNFYAADGSALTLPLGADGSVSSLTGTIAGGQIRVIQTDGTGSDIVAGSAALTSISPIGGTAIFTAPAAGGQAPAEAASPLTASSAQTIYFPYDLTGSLSTTIELANPGAAPASVTMSFADPTGKALSETATATIPPHGHYESVIGTAFSSLQGTNGVVQVHSTTVLTGLGIRYNGPNFTSFPAIIPGSN